MTSRFKRFNVFHKIQSLEQALRLRLARCIVVRAERCARRRLFLDFLGRSQYKYRRVEKRIWKLHSYYSTKKLVGERRILSGRFRLVLYHWAASYPIYTIISNFENYNAPRFLVGRKLWIGENKYYAFTNRLYLGRTTNFANLQVFWLYSALQFYTLEELSFKREKGELLHMLPCYYNEVVILDVCLTEDLIDLICFVDFLSVVNFLCLD